MDTSLFESCCVGTPHGIGTRVWDLLNGCDDTEVGQAREVPKQISIEDSYRRLDTMEDVLKELHMLAASLLKRMHADLLGNDDDDLSELTTDFAPTNTDQLQVPATGTSEQR
jgi:DNA polymerase iota